MTPWELLVLTLVLAWVVLCVLGLGMLWLYTVVYDWLWKLDRTDEEVRRRAR